MSVEKVKKDFSEVTETVDKTFGKGYSAKNPTLVMHLITTIQQEEDREVSKKINKLNSK